MAKRGGFPGGGMPGNMANLMKQAQKMQKQMEEQAKEMEEKSFTATAGGGAVEVTISFILSKINSPTSLSKLLIVPSITTSSGITFGTSPPTNLPIVTTADSVADISLVKIV